MTYLIKDIADCERPYEKAAEYGVNVLSDAELLACILRNGTQNTSSINLANSILNAHATEKGLYGMGLLSREDLLEIHGIGSVKATQIMAVCEIATRIINTSYKKRISFTSCESVGEYYINKCRFLEKERTYLLLFNTTHELIKELILTEGTVRAALVSPREIFIEALRNKAVFIILVHNHPSGNPAPSRKDIDLSIKLKQAGDLLEVELSDHIIVGHNSYVSLKNRGII